MSLFTPRERDILHLVADLQGRAEIQAVLGCHISTVNTYLTHLYEKAEVHSLIHLARYALEHGYGYRFQAASQEMHEPKQERRDIGLTGRNIHNAFSAIYPHLQPSWRNLMLSSKRGYEEVALELNGLLEKERKELDHNIPTHRR